MTKIDFIYEMTIITPLTDIVNKLENKQYRDSDIDYLNRKLKHFTKLALDILGKRIEIGEPVTGRMNEYNSTRFLEYFNTLIKFFKQY